jgi:hypothetical protein
MALATGADDAEAAVAGAVKAAKNNPLSFTVKEVEGLVRRLQDRRAEPPGAEGDYGRPVLS